MADLNHPPVAVPAHVCSGTYPAHVCSGTYERTLLGVLAGILSLSVWIIIFSVDCSVTAFAREEHDATAIYTGGFVLSAIVQMPFALHAAYNEAVEITPRVRVLLRAFCMVSSLVWSNTFKDGPSLLLHVVDDFGFMESTVVLSVAAIRTLCSEGWFGGWILSLFYALALLFMKCEIASWYQERDEKLKES